MARKKKSRKQPLREQIEKQIIPPATSNDHTFEEVEDFVPGLLDEISRGLKLPETNLKSVDSARHAVAELDNKLKELKNYHQRVHKLRELLLQKRHAMLSAQEIRSLSKILPEDLD